jgi:hypothetical protein
MKEYEKKFIPMGIFHKGRVYHAAEKAASAQTWLIPIWCLDWYQLLSFLLKIHHFQ